MKVDQGEITKFVTIGVKATLSLLCRDLRLSTSLAMLPGGNMSLTTGGARIIIRWGIVLWNLGTLRVGGWAEQGLANVLTQLKHLNKRKLGGKTSFVNWGVAPSLWSPSGTWRSSTLCFDETRTNAWCMRPRSRSWGPRVEIYKKLKIKVTLFEKIIAYGRPLIRGHQGLRFQSPSASVEGGMLNKLRTSFGTLTWLRMRQRRWTPFCYISSRIRRFGGVVGAPRLKRDFAPPPHEKS